MKKGDIVNIKDGSYIFGIQDGEYTTYYSYKNDSRKNLTVIASGLRTMKNCNGNRGGSFTEVCDILVTDNKGSYWFTQSRFCELAKHTIVIDDKLIEISHESYENLKKQLL